MASIFGHIAASTAIGAAFFPKQMRTATYVLAGFCAFAPDLDVLSFRFGIPYGSEWGHRGWTHSLVFAGALGSLTGWLFFRKDPHLLKIMLLLVICTASHPLLDMLTNGGLGVALWWPVDDTRIFFPAHPIVVSPLSAGAFFSRWGLKVLQSELLWIGLPGIVIVWAMRQFNKREP